MNRPEISELKGCTDGGCIFGHPGGMHTNGGCGCVKELSRIGERGRQMIRNIRELRKEIRKLQERTDDMRHAVGHALMCTDTKLCDACGVLLNEALDDDDRKNSPPTPASKP